MSEQEHPWKVTISLTKLRPVHGRTALKAESHDYESEEKAKHLYEELLLYLTGLEMLPDDVIIDENNDNVYIDEEE